MGRHEIVSSPLRTPAVVVGVPVATVLATWSTTALLGGVVPSAEEAPLRAEEPSSAALVPGAAPVGTTAPSAGPGAAGPDVVDLADRVLADPEEPATTAIRVVRVADDAPTPSVAVPRAGVDRSPGLAERRPTEERSTEQRPTDDRRLPGTGDGGAGGETARAAPPAQSAAQSAAEPAEALEASESVGPVQDAVPRSVASTRSASTVDDEESAERASERRGTVLDLDTPSGGLSVLSFG